MALKWELVLIEWVNCLKLGKSVQSLDDLHDGVFFCNIHKVIKKSTEIIPDDLTFIFDLVSQHYPNIEIRDKANVHVSDLTKTELIHVTSLLMHYTCIHDRQNVLTSPMCYNLSSPTQMYIKTFLEKVSGEISSNKLEAIIKSICGEETTKPCQFFDSLSSPISKRSPLQDILRTPATKIRKLEEKDKEILILKRELETEKFDKADLADELKQQQDKIIKLETKLKQKCSEIKRLQTEVETLEMRTPPNFQDVDSRETQRLLKMEIRSLEQYVHQCDKEQEDLRQELDNAKDKIKKLEGNCKMWQEKFFEIEDKFVYYIEHSKDQEEKIETLHKHCVELEDLLDEFRSKSTNSLEDSMLYYNRRSKGYEPLQSCEDLAHSVVDVQLKETQRKLEEALDELQNTLKEKHNLEENLHIYKQNLLKTESLLDQSNLEKDKLELELINITENLEKVQKENELLISSLKNIQEQHFQQEQIYNQEIIAKNNLLHELSDCHSNLEAVQGKLQNTQQVLREEEKAKIFLQGSLEEKEKKLEENEKTISEVSNALKTAQEENIKVATHLKNVEKELKASLNELKVSEEKNTKANEELMKIKAEISVVKEEHNNTRTTLEKEIHIWQETVSKLQITIEETSEKYEVEKSEKEVIINKLNHIEQNLSEKYDDLEELKVTVENITIEKNEVERKLEETLRNAEKKLSEEEEIKASLQNSLEEKAKELEKCENAVLGNKKILEITQEENVRLTRKLENIEREVQVNMDELHILQEENKKANTQLLDIKTEIIHIKEEHNNTKTTLKEQLYLSQEDVNKLQMSVEEATEKYAAEKNEKEIIINKLKHIEFILTQKSDELKRLKMKLEKLNIEKDVLESKLEENEFAIQRSISENKQIEKILQENEEILKNEKHKNEILNSQITKLEDQLTVDSKELEDTKHKLNELKKENENIQKLLQTKEETIVTLEIVSEKFETEISEKCVIINKLEDTERRLIATQKELEELKVTVEHVSQEKNEIEIQLTEVNNRIQKYIEKENDLQSCVTAKEKIEVALQESGTKLSEEILKNRTTVEKIKELNETLTKTKTDLDRAKLEVTQVEKESNNMQNELKERICKQELTIGELEKKLEEASQKWISEKTEITTEMEQTQKELVTTKESCEQLAIALQKVTTENKNFTEKLLEKEINLELYARIKEETDKKEQETLNKLHKESLIHQSLSKELEQKFIKTNEELTVMRYDLTKLAEEKKEVERALKGKINLQEDTIKKCREAINEVTNNYNAEVYGNKILKSQLEETQAQLITSNEYLDELKVILQKISMNKNDLENKLTEKKSLAEKFVLINEETENKFQNCMAALKDEVLRRKETIEEMKKLENKVIKSTADLALTKKDLNRVVEDRNKLEKTLKEQIFMQEKIIVKLQSDLKEIKEKYETTIPSKNEAIKKLEETNQELSRALEEIKEELRKQKYDREENKQNIAKVQTELLNAKNDLENTKGTLHDVISHKNNLEEDLKQKIQNFEELKVSLERTQGNELAMLDDLNLTYQKLNTLNQELKNVQQDKCTLEKEHQHLHIQFSDALKHLEKVNIEKTELEKQLLEYQHKAVVLTETETKLTQILDGKTKLEADFDRIKLECEDITKEKNDHYRKFEDTLQQLQNVEEKRIKDEDTTRKKIEELILSLEESKKVKFENDRKLEEISEKLKESTDNNQSLSTTVDKLNTYLDSAEAKKQELANDIKQLKLALTNSEEDKTILIKSLDETIEKLEQKEEAITKLKQQNEQILDDVKEMEEEKTVISNFLDLNRDELAKVTQEKDQLLEALEMSNKDKLELIDENKYIQEEKQKIQDKFELEIEQIRNGREEIALLQEMYKKVCEENEKLLSEKNKLLCDKSEVLESLQKIIKEKEELFSELNNVSAALQTLKKEKAAIFSDYQDLEAAHKNCANIQDKTDKLKLKYKEVLEENKRIVTENNKLQENLNLAEKDKKNMLLLLELGQKEAQKVKKERNEILQSQTALMKETESSILKANEVALLEKKELVKKIEYLGKERDKLREAYAAVVTSNAKQENENLSLRKHIEERNKQMQQYNGLKDGYEKLLEENNKYMTEVDTLKFKRSKDKEEYFILLNRERDEAEAMLNKKTRDVMAQYEEKLERMKQKMITFYNEERSKEKPGQDNVNLLHKTISDLRNQLFEAERKIHTLKMERDKFRQTQDTIVFRESMPVIPVERNVPKQSITSLRGRGNKVADRDSIISGASLSSLRDSYMQRQLQKQTGVQMKKTSTLPSRLASSDFIEETVTFSRRTSINSIGRNFEMEDEEDDVFNTKYLADLKEGRCNTNNGRESNISRVSELAQRNTMCPPHLKSSYPAETQFLTPSKFPEDDIKTGQIDLDDSQSRLLPGDKPRPKKDFGTTTYKKPGPPTPSKNGGRLSLQGNEIQPLKEYNHPSPIKKTTPGRLRALFSRKDTAKENAENLTPKASKRFSFKSRK